MERHRRAGFHNADAVDEQGDFFLDGGGAAAAQGHHQAAPVGVGAIDCRLDQVAAGDGFGGQAGVGVAARAVHLHGDEAGGALAVAGQHPGQAGADLMQGIVEGGGVGGTVVNDGIAGAPVGEGEESVVGAAVAVHGEHIESCVGDGLDGGLEEAGVNGGVGGGKGQHRCHIGVNHPGAFGHAADGDGLAGGRGERNRRFFGMGVRSHHSAGQFAAAVVGQRNLRYPGADEGHGQFHADDAGAAHQHVGGVQAQAVGGEAGHLRGVLVALGADAGIGDAGVDNQGAGAAGGDPFPVQVNGGGADGRGGEHAANGARRVGDEQRQIQLVRAPGFQADINAAGGETLRRGDGAIGDGSNVCAGGHSGGLLEVGVSGENAG